MLFMKNKSQYYINKTKTFPSGEIQTLRQKSTLCKKFIHRRKMLISYRKKKKNLNPI